MQIRYIGFDHKENTRRFQFEVFREGAPIERCAVLADVSLFLQYGIALQEGPALCAQKLIQAAETGAEMYTLGAEDVSAVVESRRAAEAENSRRRSRRSEAQGA